jgi:putative ABC transport system permease protein
MFDLDKWQEIFGTIRQNKLRTFLTAFGVFWGIFMLILLLGAGKGMQNGIGQEFADEAMNSVWVWQGKTSMPYQGMKAGREIRFANEDLKLIANDLGDKTNMIAPRNNLWGEYTMNYKNKNGSYRVFGSVGEFFKLNGEKMVKGRNLNQKDIDEKRKVVVIGEKVRKTLFGDNEAIGEYVNIKGVYFKVIGTFTTNQNQGRNEERAYIPFSTLQTAICLV